MQKIFYDNDCFNNHQRAKWLSDNGNLEVKAKQNSVK